MMLKQKLVVAVALLWLSPLALANVVIVGTRVVYDGADREVTVKMNNPGQTPSLVQVWVDRGNTRSTPQTADAPFLVMPPIFRVDPDKAQTVRISFTGEALPTDKESLFWLNVLDIPPLPQDERKDRNYMQIAFRSRLKLFYRPPGLTGNPETAAEQISWSLVPLGKGYALHGVNASPYNLSLSVAELKVAGHVYQSDGGVIAPGAAQNFELKGLKALPQGTLGGRYETINDYGAVVTHQLQLTR